MVLDAMRLHWKDPHAQRNGRRGQRQEGVDIFGTSHDRSVGAQAKNMNAIDEAVLRKEVAKAETFVPALDRYFVVVAGARDAGLQEKVRVLSAERRRLGRFTVQLMCFDDVCHEIATDTALVRKYWGAFLHEVESLLVAGPHDGRHPIMDLDAAFDRVMGLREYVAFADRLREWEDGSVKAYVRLESAPSLDAERGSAERAWQMSIGEDYETRAHRLHSVAVDVDTGAISIFDSNTESWIPYEQGEALSLLKP
jgi:hypothetical protein